MITTKKNIFSKRIVPVMLAVLMILTSFGAFVGNVYAESGLTPKPISGKVVWDDLKDYIHDNWMGKGYDYSDYDCSNFVWQVMKAKKGYGLTKLPYRNTDAFWKKYKKKNVFSDGHHPVDSSETSKYYKWFEDGIIQPGDIIMFFKDKSGTDPVHMGIVGGKNSDDKLTIYHSSTSNGPTRDTIDYVFNWNTGGEKVYHSYSVMRGIGSGGYLELIKSSANSSATDGNPNYSLEGAKYNIYDDDGDLVDTLITDSKGYAKTDDILPSGSYTVKEISASEGYAVTVGTETVSIETDDEVLKVKETPFYGQVKLIKESGNTPISDKNDCYSLAGAVYEVKGAESFNSSETRTITTDSDGTAQTAANLPLGKYTVKEITPSKGYAIDPTPHSVTLSKDYVVDGIVAKTVTSIELPQNDPVYIMLKKADSETEINVPQGGASLENAEYTIKYFDGYYNTEEQANNSGKPTRQWVYKTTAGGLINLQDPTLLVSGDELYYDTYNKVCFPLGTVVIQETKAPTGYLLDETVHVRQLLGDGKAETVKTYTSPTSIEQVKRGDLELVKIGEKTHERLANVPFKLTSQTTGESHIIMTDENGYASTHSDWNPHSQNTNRGETSEDGVWFSLNHDGEGNYFNESAPNDDKGALIYDVYSIEELRCESNQGKELIPAFNVRIYKDNDTVKLGTLNNYDETPPEIGTTAKDGESGTDNVVKDTEAVIVDTVEYSNLTVGKEYTLIGTLMDKSTGEPLLISGQAIKSEVTFTPTKASGSVDVVFTFDASALKAGSEIVVFENLFQDSIEVAVHADINDKGQTVTITEPQLRTKATDKETGGKEIIAGEKVTIVDTVSYENLVVGKTYVVKGKLMDKTTNKPLIIDGKEVTAEKEFVPKTKDGTIALEFTFDSTSLIGKEIVVFEDLYRDEILIAQHADIEDKDQTVKIAETPSEKEDTPNSPSGGSSKTGDKFNIWLMIVLALSALGALIAKIVRSKKSIS